MAKRKRKPMVYIAGPISQGPMTQNTRLAMLLWDRLRNEGFCPICPHWSVLQDIFIPLLHEQWLEHDKEIILRCDVLFRMMGESKGADEEVAWANANNIPVIWSLSDLHTWKEEYDNDEADPEE